MSLAELTIPIQNLRNLPVGAAYTNKQGATRLTASVEGDSLRIMAESEGGTLQSYTQEESQVHIRDQLEQEKVIEEPVAIPVFTRFKWCLTGILIAIIIFLFIKYRRKWQNIF